MTELKQEITEMSKQKKIEFEKRAIELGLTGKSAIEYVKNQMNIWEREQKEKEKAEAKLLGTAMQQLLPEIFEDKRAIPNCFLRGALFGMVRPGQRKLVGDMPIFTMSQYEVSFSGYELDQNDLELWDTLMYLAKNRQVNSELKITLYELCQQMKVSNNGQNRNALVTRAKRLAFCKASIKTGNKEFFGGLINNVYIDKDGDGKLVIEYNKRLAPLLTGNQYTLVSADIRHLLGENQLAKWLYNFYESHQEPLAFTIDFIQKLCRSATEPKDFKRKIKNALEEVKKAHLAVNLKSKWDYEITENNYIMIYQKGRTKKQQSLFGKF